jgi:hypothetical protein
LYVLAGRARVLEKETGEHHQEELKKDKSQVCPKDLYAENSVTAVYDLVK